MANTFGLSEKICDAESKCLSCGAPLPAGREEQRKFTGGRTSIVVLGDESDDTRKLFDNANEAVKKLGNSIEVELVTDADMIKTYNLRSLPALIVNGSIASQGLISDADSIVSDIEFLG